MTPSEFTLAIQKALEAERNPAKAGPMAHYMKDQFPFLGLTKPERQKLTKPIFAEVKSTADEAWLTEVAHLLWAMPEREYQYVAADLLQIQCKKLSASQLSLAEELITRKSWWDSVDALTNYLVGPLVLRFPEFKSTLDGWSRHENFWLRRSAILHQLGFKTKTDAQRLFQYCFENADSEEFFIRKGIGWALRTYARTDPQAVYEFVEQHQDKLSALSIREALKHKT
jgi:3-methyladenine DNA glycosylase AlkD